MLGKLGIISGLLCIVIAVREPTFKKIQEHNLNNLTVALKTGYRAFCEQEIDHGVLSLHGDGDPHDALVELHSRTTSVTSSLKDIHKLIFEDLDRSKKTIFYINGYISPDFDILTNVRKIAKCSGLYNVLILNLACSLQMHYNTVIRNTPVFSYAVFKILIDLMQRLAKQKLVLVGHSQGAQIASAAAKLFHQQLGRKLPLLIVLDPAIPCNPAHQYVQPDIAEQVLVIHTNCGDFGLEYSLGTIDYYPNGEVKLQPGCKDQLCSHERSVQLFAEAVCSPGSFLAVKCKDWKTFQRKMCYTGIVIPISLRTLPGTQGKYFGFTRQSSPFGLGFAGVSPTQSNGWWTHEL